MGKRILVAENVGLCFRLRLERKPTLRHTLLRGWKGRGAPRTFRALDGVSFELARGETLGVIGPNGSGKSTLLRVVAGIYPPDDGRIAVQGRVSTLLSLTAGFQTELSGRENIMLVGMLLGFARGYLAEHIDDIIEFASIGEFIDASVKTYSSGMTARLGFAIATNLDCDILLVDEILGVGDREFRERSKAKIAELLGKERTVLLVSHDLNAILEYSTQVLWLDHGKVVEHGDPERVVKAYQSHTGSRGQGAGR